MHLTDDSTQKFSVVSIIFSIGFIAVGKRGRFISMDTVCCHWWVLIGYYSSATPNGKTDRESRLA